MSNLKAGTESGMNAITTLLLLMALSLFTMACASAPPIGAAEAERKIAAAFATATAKGNSGEVASLLVHSDRLGIHAQYMANRDGPAAFHIASVGKLFTTVLVGRLIDAGKLELDTRVAPLLPPATLDGLFVYRGTDYQSGVTVEQLLAHTSGVADYFSGPVRGGKSEPSVDSLIVTDPGRLWTPLELLAFSRDRQEAVGAPGETYNYSDTGFIILGLLIEELYGHSFQDVLSVEILAPLDMNETFMPFVSKPASGSDVTIRKAWLGKTEVSTFTSITADWSGGGIASTEGDLLKFSKALWAGILLSDETLSELRHYTHVFMKGLDYGAGLMRIDFGKFFFLLKGYPKPEGHIGILATMLIYDPERDLHIVLNFGDTEKMESAFRLVIQAFGILLRVGPGI